MELIQSITVSGTATSLVEFTSIPQDASHLFLVLSLRTTHTATVDSRIRINNVSTNYEEMTFDGTANNSAPNFRVPGTNNATHWAVGNLTIQDYTKTGLKGMLLEGQAIMPTTSVAGHNASAYNTVSSNTAAVTSIQIDLRISTTNYNFADGSRIALYKLNKGTGGATFA